MTKVVNIILTSCKKLATHYYFPNWCTWNDNIKVFYNLFQIFVNWGLILTILTLWKQLRGVLYIQFFSFHFLVNLHFNPISLFLARELSIFCCKRFPNNWLMILFFNFWYFSIMVFDFFFSMMGGWSTQQWEVLICSVCW